MTGTEQGTSKRHEGESLDSEPQSKGNISTRQGHEEQHQGDDIDTSTHASLAAMSTDDVSSMGETLVTHQTGVTATSGGRRKRKDDCSESRCTVNSEDSGRSRSRRRRCRSLIPDQRRWRDRIDRKAATSHAPIRPSRSDDDTFFPPATGPTVSAAYATTAQPDFSFQRSLSYSLPRIGTGFDHASSLLCASKGLDAAANAAREVARCQSMSLPPVRPTRTRDDSKTDLMKDVSKTECEDDENETEKNEIDPDMFVRLLSGQQDGHASLTPPGLATARSGGGQMATSSADPPKKPRRRSDADVHQRPIDRNSSNALRRFDTVTSSRRHHADAPATPSSRVCPHKCQGMRDSCSHAISPKPPAKPSRTSDDNISDADVFPNLSHIPLLPMLPSVLLHDKSSAILTDKTAGNCQMQAKDDIESEKRHTMSSSNHNRMEVEKVEVDFVEQQTVGGTVADQDETEVSMPTSAKEYDPDLFARLLNGGLSSSLSTTAAAPVSTTSAVDITSEEQQHPPPLLARVSTSSTKPAGNTSAGHPGYNRFDNSAPCAMPEHIKGAMKSSHPPMQPRRSFDEGMFMFSRNDAAESLANAAKVACVAGATTSSSVAEPSKPRICIVGGKRRYYRRESRRATLALASELPPSEPYATSTVLSGAALNDPTQEVNMATPLEASLDAAAEIDEGDEYEYETIDIEVADQGGYQPILPARRHRRVVRRFTMPSKGGGTMSPLSKKRRVIGRSLSCRTPEDETTPAA